MKRYVVLLLAVALITVVACGGGDSGGEKLATADEFGQAWPLSVDSGTVSCIGGGDVVISHELALMTIDGTTYGLNQDALDANYPDLEFLRIDNPAIPGVRLDLGTLISLAIRQC